MDYVAQMKALPKKHDFFIGIDSDGCVFDTMEIKQKECFCPTFIKHFGLQAGSKYAREVWEFVNLHSRDRGCNRFLAVQKALKLSGERDVFAERGLKITGIPAMDALIKEESKLGNATTSAPILTNALTSRAASFFTRIGPAAAGRRPRKAIRLRAATLGRACK